MKQSVLVPEGGSHQAKTSTGASTKQQVKFRPHWCLLLWLLRSNQTGHLAWSRSHLSLLTMCLSWQVHLMGGSRPGQMAESPGWKSTSLGRYFISRTYPDHSMWVCGCPCNQAVILWIAVPSWTPRWRRYIRMAESGASQSGPSQCTLGWQLLLLSDHSLKGTVSASFPVRSLFWTYAAKGVTKVQSLTKANTLSKHPS